MPSAPSGASESIDQTLADLTSTIEGPDAVPPLLQDDSRTVRGSKTVVAATAGQGVLANDTDPNADTLTVTGVSDTSHGAGTVGAPLVGAMRHADAQRPTAPTATMPITAQAVWSEGQLRARRLHLRGDRSAGQSRHGHARPSQSSAIPTASWTSTAYHGRGIEDRRQDLRRSLRQHGPLHASAAASRRRAAPINLGGTWTYTITNIGRADSVASGRRPIRASLTTSTTSTPIPASHYSTFFGHTGFNLGIADKIVLLREATISAPTATSSSVNGKIDRDRQRQVCGAGGTVTGTQRGHGGGDLSGAGIGDRRRHHRRPVRQCGPLHRRQQP